MHLHFLYARSHSSAIAYITMRHSVWESHHAFTSPPTAWKGDKRAKQRAAFHFSRDCADDLNVSVKYLILGLKITRRFRPHIELCDCNADNTREKLRGKCQSISYMATCSVVPYTGSFVSYLLLWRLYHLIDLLHIYSGDPTPVLPQSDLVILIVFFKKRLGIM